MVLEYKRPHWSTISKESEDSCVTCDKKFHEKRVYCVRSCPDQPNMFITGGWDRVVKVFFIVKIIYFHYTGIFKVLLPV